MAYPSDRKYSKEHEWVAVEEGNSALIGITDFAQEELGDVVYVALPQVEARVTQFGQMGEIESVKAVSDLYSPVSGTVIEVNQQLTEHPELVNDDPHGAGWMIRVEMDNPSELDNLMSADEYQAMVSGGA